MRCRAVSAVTWNLAGFDPQTAVTDAEVEQAAAIKSTVDQHCIVCLQELASFSPASELEQQLGQLLELNPDRHTVVCNHEETSHTQRLAVVLNLGQLGLTAADKRPIRLGSFISNSGRPADGPKFVGAELNPSGGRQLVVGSLYRPQQSKSDESTWTFKLLSDLLSTLRVVYPRALFFIGGAFNANPHSTAEEEVRLLQAFFDVRGLHIIPSTAPTGSSRPMHFFLASEELLALIGFDSSLLPKSKQEGSILPTTLHSAHHPVSLALEWQHLSTLLQAAAPTAGPAAETSPTPAPQPTAEPAAAPLPTPAPQPTAAPKPAAEAFAR